MELSDIKTSISDMSEEELRKLLLDIRQSRRTSKRAASVAHAGRTPKEVNPDVLLESLSPDMIARLLEKMGG